MEAANADEAFVALGEPTLSIDVILCDVSALGSQSGFELARWVRTNRPELEVRLAGGVAMADQTAAELCESGPYLARPYEPEAVGASGLHNVFPCPRARQACPCPARLRTRP